MYETVDSSLASRKPLPKGQVDVPVLIESFTKDFVLGLQLYSVDDPTDPNFCYIAPKIYIKHQKELLPREIIMLIDVSESMTGVGIEGVKATLPKIFDSLLDNDQITIKTFSKVIGEKITHIKFDLTNNFNEINNSIQANTEHSGIGGDTALYDAILSLVEDRKDIRDTGCTTVLLFSDGRDSASKFKGTPAELLQKYNQAFENKAPRFLPVGLGKAYDYEFIKKCAIATNFGMIDARDMTKLGDHVKHIINGLACGVHATIQIADSKSINLGIINFNTENTIDPIRVSKKSIKQNQIAGAITIAGKISKFSAPMEAVLSSEEKKELIDTAVTKLARKIYDGYDLNFDQKMTAIEQLLKDFKEHLSETVYQTLEDLHRIIELKSINEQVETKLFDPASDGWTLFVDGWHSKQTLKELQNIKASFPENQRYLNKIISLFDSEDANKLAASFQNATISRIPEDVLNIIAIEDYNAVNCYKPTSTITSSPFTANLTNSSDYSASVTPLNRVLNFATLKKDKIIKSIFEGRESITLNVNSKHMQQFRDELIREIGEEKGLDEIIQILMSFVNKKFPSNDFKAEKSDLDLEEIITKGQGVCRHHSLFTAYLLGQLVEQEKLPRARVNHYRAATNQLTAHSFVVYANDNNFTIVDSAQGFSFSIKDQDDFEQCVKLYNEKALHWILRNFAKDHGFIYPASENNLALGQAAIDRLAAKAEKKLDLATEIREKGLRCTVSQLIMGNPMKTNMGMSVENSENIFQIKRFVGFEDWEPDLDKKMALWNLLVEQNCILPEEDCLGGKLQALESTAKELRNQNINAALNKETPKNKLLKIINNIQDNILTEKNGRWTSRNGQWKVDLLENIAQNLRDNLNVNIQQCISNTLEVCKQGRNDWHFWAEPHSVSEFKSALAEAGLGLGSVDEIKSSVATHLEIS